MELLYYKKKKVAMLRVNEQEALRLISSLARQLLTGDCNSERVEIICVDGVDFSIAVLTGETT